MATRRLRKRLGMHSSWSQEIGAAVIALLVGVAVLPIAIFYAGALSVGRYEGASIGRLYESLFHGFSSGSIASWIVLLGPYGLYLLFKALRLWWRASANLA
jgi:hypothetical protein